jgi:hypothetical protein
MTFQSVSFFHLIDYSFSLRHYLISIQEKQQGVVMKLENVKTSQALSVSVLIALILVTFFMALPKF